MEDFFERKDGAYEGTEDSENTEVTAFGDNAEKQDQDLECGENIAEFLIGFCGLTHVYLLERLKRRKLGS